MQRTLKAPPKLSNDEKRKLERFIWMADWHFEALIKPNCTEISKFTIHWDRSGGKLEAKQAFVYGLQAIYSQTKEPCIGNFFVRYYNQIHQMDNIEEAVSLIKLLKKEYEYEMYEEKLRKQRVEEREKLERQKNKLKGKVRKIKVVKEKAA